MDFGVAWKLLEHFGYSDTVGEMKGKSRGVSDLKVNAKRRARSVSGHKNLDMTESVIINEVTSTAREMGVQIQPQWEG